MLKWRQKSKSKAPRLEERQVSSSSSEGEEEEEEQRPSEIYWQPERPVVAEGSIIAGYNYDSKKPISARGSAQYPSAEQVSKALRTRYQYRKLNERRDDLRLIRVNYSQGDGGLINCDFEQLAMSDMVGNHTYQAISYAWGNPSLVGEVLCDHYTSSLDVTRSMLDVLGRLVDLSSGVAGRHRYWIDGLCIDQTNLQERSTQIGRMANIYRRAERVHIFLGTFDSHTSSLLESKWFTRRWVIQEAIAAQKVVVHFRKMGIWHELNGWEALMSEAVRLPSLAGIDQKYLPAAKFLNHLSNTTRTRWSGIFPLLLKFHTAQCMDDSDRLFALLGVSNDVELRNQPGEVSAHMAPFQALKIWFKPDYALDTDEVYRKFALAAIQSHFAFDLLHCAGTFRPRSVEGLQRDLPTWVPDWRCPLLYNPLLEASGCRAGMLKSKRKQTIAVNDLGQGLRLKGVPLGTVQQTVGKSPQFDQFPERLRFVGVDWINYAEHKHGPSLSIDLGVDRVCVKLTSGLKAIVPLDICGGDEVVIFIGARTPFVLRRKDGSESVPVRHCLIGDCYVSDDGVMNGEALNKTLNGILSEPLSAADSLDPCRDYLIV